MNIWHTGSHKTTSNALLICQFSSKATHLSFVGKLILLMLMGTHIVRAMLMLQSELTRQNKVNKVGGMTAYALNWPAALAVGIPYCTVLYRTYRTVPYVPYGTVCTVLYRMYCTVPYVPYCTVCTVLYRTYCTVTYVLYSTV